LKENATKKQKTNACTGN